MCIRDSGWENIHLADRIEKETGLPALLGNDANLMGLGETMYGAGQGATHVVFLTVGTGIGGAVVILSLIHILVKNYKSWSKLFPKNQAIKYFATEGKEGALPDYMSKGFLRCV